MFAFLINTIFFQISDKNPPSPPQIGGKQKLSVKKKKNSLVENPIFRHKKFMEKF